MSTTSPGSDPDDGEDLGDDNAPGWSMKSQSCHYHQSSNVATC